jgi:site-specific recombinase XerD
LEHQDKRLFKREYCPVRIKKNLILDMALHTFATTVTLTNGVTLEAVGRMLGHMKIGTAQIYAKIFENTGR